MPTAYNGFGRLDTSPDTSKISSSLILVSLKKKVFELITLDTIIEASNKDVGNSDIRSFVVWVVAFLELSIDKDVLDSANTDKNKRRVKYDETKSIL